MLNHREDEMVPTRSPVGEIGKPNQLVLESYWTGLITEGIQVALFSLDQLWRFTYLNNAATKMLGRSKESLTGKVIWEEFPDLLGTNYEKFYRKAMEEASPYQSEEFYPPSQAWYEVRTYPVPEGMIVSFEDITSRKQIEQSLKESEYRYKFLSAATSEGVVIHRDGTIIEANDSNARIFGYNSSQELIGRSTFDFVAPESLAKVQKRVSEHSEEMYEVIGLKKDGSRICLESCGKNIEYQGQPARQLAFRDITERNRKEQQLRDSEARYKALSEAAFEGIIMHRDGIIVEANQTAVQMAGYDSLEEFVGQPLFPLIAPEQLETVRQHITDNSLESYESIIVRKDGSRFPVEVRAKIIEYQGQTVRVAALKDITESKLKEQALRESQYRFKILSGATREGVIIHRNGIIIEANQSIADLLGFSSPHQLLGRSLFDMIVPEDRAAIQKYAAEGSEEVHELMSLKRGGDPFPMEVCGKNIEYRGLPARQVTLRDITELKRKEQALKDSEERYRILSEASYEGLVISSNGVILEANQRLADMFGYSLEEFIGLSFEQLIAPEVLPAMQERILNNRIEPSQTIGVRKDGSRFFHEARGQIIEYKGRPTRVVAIRDMTEIKQAQENLLKVQQQLAQAQKMESIGRLAGGIAHDFNNILTAITGYSELLLLKLKENDALYKDVLEIEKASDRATALTRQLLAFSRQQVLQPKRLNLNRVVTEMDKLLHRLIGEDIEIATVLEPQLGEVLADPGQLEQVIMNLAVNSRDALPEGGRLTLETANVELDAEYQASGHPQVKTGSYVMLAVSDNGLGMDQATQERIFEPFFTTKEKGKGTGLGLATVYGIVEQSGGHILVYSEPGVGTSFKIYLPRISESDAVLAPSLPKSSGRDTGPAEANQARTVLIVEDDDLVEELLDRVLTKAGYTILTAHNGQEALDLMTNYHGKLDIVLTDIIMPKMGGQELIGQIKTRWPTLKVIGMSGYTDRSIEHHGALAQCDAFVQKPFTPAALLNRIAELLLIPSPAS